MYGNYTLRRPEILFKNDLRPVTSLQQINPSFCQHLPNGISKLLEKFSSSPWQVSNLKDPQNPLFTRLDKIVAFVKSQGRIISPERSSDTRKT